MLCVVWPRRDWLRRDVAGGLYMLEIPRDAVFTYSITEAPDPAFAQSRQLFGALFLNMTKATECRESTSPDGLAEVVIIGLCVDAHGEYTREEIPGIVLNAALDRGIESAYFMCDRLAGKYVVYLNLRGEKRIWGDATCSLSIFYSSNTKAMACGVSECVVADSIGDHSQRNAAAIAANAPSGQPLPCDATSYDHVKVLLPNHILNINEQRADRLWQPLKQTAGKSLEQIADESLVLMRNIYREYERYYDLVCPLTVGYDSRVNFALMKELSNTPECFTFKHPSFTDQTPDLKGARELCCAFRVPHSVVVDCSMNAPEKSRLKALVGRDATSYSLDLASTIKKSFGRRAILNGSVIDQIGKSVTGNDIPERLASARFVRARIYNRGRPALRVLRPYVRSVRNRCKGHVFDVLAWEQDCCRWATQSDITYGMCGVNMLTLSNCRELILGWLSVSRKQRVHKKIHEALLQRLDPQLLTFDFTPESATKRVLRINWLLFYVSCFFYGALVARRSLMGASGN